MLPNHFYFYRGKENVADENELNANNRKQNGGAVPKVYLKQKQNSIIFIILNFTVSTNKITSFFVNS